VQYDIDFVCHDDLPYVDTSGASGCGDVYLPLKRCVPQKQQQTLAGASVVAAWRSM
jgi:hypothetical protein